LSSLTFSIIIPTYNHAGYLDHALKSVLNQTYQDFEVIVVNNYSTDDTLEVIERTSDPRVKVINFRNYGVIGSSRNKGILSARGRYVAFLDSDDWWHSDKLEKVVTIFERHSDVDLVCHCENYIRNGTRRGRSNCIVPKRFRTNIFDYMLFGDSCIVTSATVVKREKLIGIGLFNEDPAFTTVEDYDLWLRLARVSQFYFMREVLGEHRYHSASETAKIEMHINNLLSLLQFYLQGLEGGSDGLVCRRIKRRYAIAYYGGGRGFHRSGCLGKSLQFYWKAIQAYPLYWKTYLALGLLMCCSILRRLRVGAD